ncbi:UNVERIFIED_CONTAM: Pre-splicing factor ATP-dependent RNA helicase DEAH10, partial [Sesamum radiatum]
EKRLLEEVNKNDILIIVGETGSGKTTQLPQYLFNGGFCRNGGIIGITQPRRVAAVTVAKRVAEECGVALGQKVGYGIRFEDVTSSSTRIKYMTDGLLLREALLDPYLSKYSVIIVDEAHERTVHTDVLLGLLKTVQKTRSQGANDMVHNGHPKGENGAILEKENDIQSTNILKHNRGKKLSPLKLIIMSASLDAQIFSKYFGGARAVHVQGRQYPVDILYTHQPETDYIDAALITIFQIHLEEAPGDVLVFLTGQEEIESIERLVQERLPKLPENKRKLLVIPIFASLPSEKQMKVFMPAPVGFRKVILATNIAETSVTIPGIKYVIDPGMVKVRTYDASTGIEPLIIVKTSKAQALQRSGRAGREGPGKCYRLYPENEFYKLKDSTTPEIKRCNLSNVILQLKALGIDDIVGFDFIEEPDRMAIIKSMELLFLLGALTDSSKLSEVGHQMARLPLDPIYSKALIVASQFSCLEEMLIVVAMLSVESIFYAPREKLEESRTALRSFSSPEGDHLTLLNVYRASDEFLEKSKLVSSNEKAEKNLRKWCKENFINSRSLKHARDIHSQIRRNAEQMGLRVTSCGDDILPLRRCVAASFFLNAALKQPDGTYRNRSPRYMKYIARIDCKYASLCRQLGWGFDGLLDVIKVACFNPLQGWANRRLQVHLLMLSFDREWHSKASSLPSHSMQIAAAKASSSHKDFLPPWLSPSATSRISRRQASSKSKTEVVFDDSYIKQQAQIATMLYHHHLQNNGGDLLLHLERSISTKSPPSSSKKQKSLIRRSRSVSSSSPLSTSLQLHNQDAARSGGVAESKHFVLVHGGGFGAWCWYKIIALLKEGECEVDAIDLTGSGANFCDINFITTLPQFAKPLTAFLANLADNKQVILVGHDLGGACISYAMELYPTKVSKAIFVAATMLNNGQSALDVFSQQSCLSDVNQRAQKFLYANGKNHQPTAIQFDESVLEDFLFNRTPSKDIALASVSMRAVPFAPVTEKLSLSASNYGSVSRFYIKTDDDFAIPFRRP